MSRGWAAGIGSGGSFERFRNQIGPAADRLGNAKALLVEMQDQLRLQQEAAAKWENVFFGGSAPEKSVLLEAEVRRVDTTNRLMFMRRHFAGVRRSLPAARWQVAGPDETRLRQMDRLADPAAAFSGTERSRIYESHAVPGPRGDEFWIRMRPPVLGTGEWAWCRVQMPRNGDVKGILILLQGIFIEPEMWRSLAAPAATLVDRGIALITPEAPWHGRRCPLGEYGGESILGRGPLGFIDALEAAVVEAGQWIQWGRERTDAPIAIGGVSLGALTAQVVLSASSNWPESARPDGGLLVTTTDDMVEAAFDGSLATATGLRKKMQDAGWTRDALGKFAPLLEPSPDVPIDPDKIVMVLGSEDTITAYRGGCSLAEKWLVPSGNLFVSRRGHFSASLGLCRDVAPLDRMADILLANG